MSRRRTRAANRRAKLEVLRAEFQEKRRDPVALEAFLRRHAGLERRLWEIARTPAGADPLDDAELAMISQFVAPSLAGMAAPTAWHVARQSQVIVLKVQRSR